MLSFYVCGHWDYLKGSNLQQWFFLTDAVPIFFNPQDEIHSGGLFNELLRHNSLFFEKIQSRSRIWPTPGLISLITVQDYSDSGVRKDVYHCINPGGVRELLPSMDHYIWSNFSCNRHECNEIHMIHSSDFQNISFEISPRRYVKWYWKVENWSICNFSKMFESKQKFLQKLKSFRKLLLVG